MITTGEPNVVCKYIIAGSLITVMTYVIAKLFLYFNNSQHMFIFCLAISALCVLYIGSEGVTIGAHRCFAHRSFKATPLLRAVMVITQTLAGQVN